MLSVTLVRNTRSFLLILFLFSVLLSCTKPKDENQLKLDIVWSKSWGGSRSDYGEAIVMDPSGNYVFLADASSADGDLTGYAPGSFLMKFSPEGQMLWQKAIPNVDFRSVTALALCGDGGFVSGGTNTTKALGGALVSRFDGSGTLLWQSQIDTGGSYVTGIAETPDGYIASATMIGQFSTGSDFYLLNKSGARTGISWTNVGGRHYAMIPLPGNTFLVAGGNTAQTSRDHDYASLARVNADGHELWHIQPGGQGALLTAATMTADGNILLGGVTFGTTPDVPPSRGNADIWLMKINPDGGILWSKSFGGSGNEQVYGIAANPDGNCLVAASTDSNDGDVKANHGKKDIWLLKVDSSGNLLGQQSLGGSDDDYPAAITRDNSGAYVLIGSTNSTDGQVIGNHGGNYMQGDAWILKFKER